MSTTFDTSQPSRIEDEIVSSVGAPNLVDLSAELSEGLLDTFIDQGPIKDIPVVGAIVKVIRAGRHISDYNFAKKLSDFFFKLNEIPEPKRRKFVEDMDAQPEFKRKVGAQLILMLERLDDFEKTELLAKAFSLYVNGTIHYEAYREYGLAIDRCFISDLQHLKSGGLNNFNVDRTIPVRLLAAGLVEMASIPQIRVPEAQNRYHCTTLGESFRNLLL